MGRLYHWQSAPDVFAVMARPKTDAYETSGHISPLPLCRYQHMAVESSFPTIDARGRDSRMVNAVLVVSAPL